MQTTWTKSQPWTLSGLLRWTLDLILRERFIFWTCIIANMIGAVVGTVWWYGPMLQQSPWWTWLFIPDCPLAVLLANIALLALYGSRHWPMLNALVAFACIKYGVWTIAFWLRHWVDVPDFAPIEMMLFVTHIGLLIEGLLFVPLIGPLALWKRLTLIGWFVSSLFVDYELGYHPPLGNLVSVQFVFSVAATMTAVLSAGLLLLPYRSDRSSRQPLAANVSAFTNDHARQTSN